MKEPRRKARGPILLISSNLVRIFIFFSLNDVERRGMKTRLTGIVAAPHTPFHADGAVALKMIPGKRPCSPATA